MSGAGDNRGASASGGVGFFGLLTIVFITLKLTGYISWSWWWVFSPLWLPIPVFIVVFIIGALIMAALDRK